MASFELGKEIEKDVFLSCHERGTKKNIPSPHEESNLRPSDSALRYSIAETQRIYGERGPLRSSCTKRVLHSIRISDVVSVVFINRTRKMVSFELGKEIEKDVFRLVRILSRAYILRSNCDRVLKRIECLHCAQIISSNAFHVFDKIKFYQM